MEDSIKEKKNILPQSQPAFEALTDEELDQIQGAKWVRKETINPDGSITITYEWVPDKPNQL